MSGNSDLFCNISHIFNPYIGYILGSLKTDSHVISKRPPGGILGQSLCRILKVQTRFPNSFFVTFRVSLSVYALIRFYSFAESHVISKRPLWGALGQSSCRIPNVRSRFPKKVSLISQLRRVLSRCLRPRSFSVAFSRYCSLSGSNRVVVDLLLFDEWLVD